MQKKHPKNLDFSHQGTHSFVPGSNVIRRNPPIDPTGFISKCSRMFFPVEGRFGWKCIPADGRKPMPYFKHTNGTHKNMADFLRRVDEKFKPISGSMIWVVFEEKNTRKNMHFCKGIFTERPLLRFFLFKFTKLYIDRGDPRPMSINNPTDSHQNSAKPSSNLYAYKSEEDHQCFFFSARPWWENLTNTSSDFRKKSKIKLDRLIIPMGSNPPL